MRLSGKQGKRIHDAILSGYTRNALVMALSFNMDVGLDEIVADGTLSEQVFALIQWAEKDDRVAELIQAVHEGNPDNRDLTALHAEAEAWFAEKPEPTAPPPVEATGAPGAPHQELEAGAPASTASAPHHVFLAYSRKDSGIMHHLRADLRAAGIVTWIDEEDLEPGTTVWEDAVESAIRAAHCVIVLMSPEAKQSEWVRIEISRAHRMGRRIFPVLARGNEDGAVPIVLETTQYVDVRTDYAGSVAGKLIPALRRHLGMAELETAQPAGEGPATPAAQAEHDQKKSAPPVTAKPPIEFDWVTIPAGEFLMGSDKAKDTMAYDDETPQHKLYLPEYRIARVPVTVEQFGAFVKATVYRTTAEQRGSARVWTGSKWEEKKGVDWAHPNGPGSDIMQKEMHPVTCVSWHDAMAFCQWAGVKLPSEAEWEKAARGSDGRIWPWGNELPTTEHCNFNMNVKDTTPVGRYSKGASPFGVLDMAGNVWEWTSSLWGEHANQCSYGYPYRLDDGRENSGAPNSVRRVLRGGSWSFDGYFVRCAFRSWHLPDSGFDDFGFRVLSPE